MTRPSELVQLASDFRGVMPSGGMMAERKWDGWRAARFPGLDGKNRLWTRGGFAIEGTGHILHALDRMERAAGEPLMFDGEFVVDGTLAATKRWCEAGWKLGGEAGVLHLFDAVPLSAWQRGEDPTPLYQRKARLGALMDAAAGDEWEWREGSRGRDEGAPPPVLYVDDEWVATPAEAIALARRVWAAGGEGCMLKVAEAPYRRKRTQDWLKVKQANQHYWRKAA